MFIRPSWEVDSFTGEYEKRHEFVVLQSIKMETEWKVKWIKMYEFKIFSQIKIVDAGNKLAKPEVKPLTKGL